MWILGPHLLWVRLLVVGAQSRCIYSSLSSHLPHSRQCVSSHLPHSRQCVRGAITWQIRRWPFYARDCASLNPRQYQGLAIAIAIAKPEVDHLSLKRSLLTRDRGHCQPIIAFQNDISKNKGISEWEFGPKPEYQNGNLGQNQNIRMGI
jgi:hypothetical protein